MRVKKTNDKALDIELNQKEYLETLKILFGICVLGSICFTAMIFYTAKNPELLVAMSGFVDVLLSTANR